VPESFKVLLKEMQALSLDVRVLDAEGQEIEIPELDPEDMAPPMPATRFSGRTEAAARDEIPAEVDEETDRAAEEAFSMSAEDLDLGGEDQDEDFSLDDTVLDESELEDFGSADLSDLKLDDDEL
jgi:DNA-directed RNA polymerase subunit beta